MPNDADPNASRPGSPTAPRSPTRAPLGAWYSYSIVRFVPRVERGESINVGAVLFSRPRRFLAARVELDHARLRAFAPGVDLAALERHLATFVAIADGDPAGGPLAALPQSERFHWLVAPRSTIIQTAPVHIGRCDDPATALDDLMRAYVRPPLAPSAP